MLIRMVLAEDQLLLRQSVRKMLESLADMTVVGEASDGLEAVALALKTRPDIVLMDVGLSGLNGVGATRRIVAQASRAGPPRVIALTMYSDRDTIFRMLEAGAAGYVLKSCDCETLVRAIRTVHGGNSYLSPEAARVVLEGWASRREGRSDPSQRLTTREKEILQLVAEGRSSKEIASFLDLSVRTVEAHRRSLMLKLRVKNVAGLVRFAMRERLAWDKAPEGAGQPVGLD